MTRSIAECVNGIIKKSECLPNTEFRDYKQAVKAIKEAVY